MRALLRWAIVIAASCGAAATSLPETNLEPRASNLDGRAVDAVFSGITRESPGCALGVFQNGAMAYARGYGVASLEHDVPITESSVFYAGSVSKQFTAMAAALAIGQGKLAYEDPIRKYLPELPAYADAVKVRHLIHHTSGLRDYNTLLAIAGRRDEEAWDNRAVLRITARQKALNFEPGAEYLYSNTGYTLLATIVERATGTAFATYADEQIFKPLGMTSSHFHTDVRRLVQHRALGYGGRSGAWTLDTPLNERAGAGGLYTNVPDLLKWDENFYTGKVGGAALLKQIQTRASLNDGTTIGYAWGLQIGQYRGAPIVEHSGSLGGYRAHLLRVPSQHVSVALLCNGASIAPTTLVRRVADLVIGNRFTDAVPAPRPGGVVGSVAGRVPDSTTATANRAYAGSYYSDELDTTVTVIARGDEVLMQRETDPAPIAAQMHGPPDQFTFRGYTVKFTPDAAKTVTGFTLDAGRVRGIVFARR
jgi:CubicO group peptidase (beta-lactamase class C family)